MTRRPLAALVAALLAVLAIAAVRPNDPLAARQWHLDTVRAYEAWDISRGGAITVAVVDTGVQLDHPDLVGKLVPGVDLIDAGTPPEDGQGHGTLVAGIIAAATDNAEGISAVAPDVRVMPIRALDDEGNGQASDVARGIDWAVDNGAQVVNLSLTESIGNFDPLAGLVATDIERAIRDADQRGVLVVAAAGNKGQSQTPYSSGTPAVVVGATDRQDQVWFESNRDNRTLFAPGVEIVSTYTAGTYAMADGTSFATPIVAAGAAMLMASGMDAARARDRLIGAAQPVFAAGAPTDGSVLPIGLGRVDLARALGITTPPTLPPPPPTFAPAPPPPPPTTVPPPPTTTTTLPPPDPPVVPPAVTEPPVANPSPVSVPDQVVVVPVTPDSLGVTTGTAGDDDQTKISVTATAAGLLVALDIAALVTLIAAKRE